MKCTFYRTEKIETKEWNVIIEKLRADLTELMSGSVSEREARRYLAELLAQALPLKKDPRMRFFGMDEPQTMPGDIRVVYFYQPTYLATAIAVRILMLFPDIAGGGPLTDAPDSMTGEEAMRVLSACMLACTGRGFKGHGFDDVKGLIEVMELFTEIDMISFLSSRPDLCPEFTRRYINVLSFLRICTERGRVAGSWGDDYTDRARAILEGSGLSDHSRIPGSFRSILGEGAVPVFVYGTLMFCASACCLMDGALYLGAASLDGCAMYSLGNYPGIVPQKGKRVAGEVYLVSSAMLSELDKYESCGTLYTRESVTADLEGAKLEAQAYIYNMEVKQMVDSGCWNLHDDDKVWYASYGSNLSEERFLCYVKGGVAPNGRPYTGCSDKTLWDADFTADVPGRMYFARESKSWDGGGVAFFLPEGEGETHMRFYRITYGQLKDIQEQEGNTPGWYGNMALLGVYRGLPAFTLTSKRPQRQNAPADSYISLIRKALINECGISETEAAGYLDRCLALLPEA